MVRISWNRMNLMKSYESSLKVGVDGLGRSIWRLRCSPSARRHQLCRRPLSLLPKNLDMIRHHRRPTLVLFFTHLLLARGSRQSIKSGLGHTSTSIAQFFNCAFGSAIIVHRFREAIGDNQNHETTRRPFASPTLSTLAEKLAEVY